MSGFTNAARFAKNSNDNPPFGSHWSRALGANLEGDQPLPMEVSGGKSGYYLEDDGVNAGEGDDEDDVLVLV